MTARKLSELSLKAQALLNKCGVESPDQLLTLKGALNRAEDLLYDMAVGLEIVAWAKGHGIEFGPAAEWQPLFDAIAELSRPCRLAVWRLSLTTKSPKEIDIDDVVTAIVTSKRDKEEFRSWALTHPTYFGISKLDGLPAPIRPYLRNARLNSPEEVAACTRDEVRFIHNLRNLMFEKVEQWLEGKGLQFATQNPWTAILSDPAQRTLAELNVRDKSALQKLRLRDFLAVKECDPIIIEEIQAWARRQDIEIPD